MSLKSVTFEKLGIAVSNADPSTVDGVEILALAASAVKNLNEGTNLEQDIYQIGIAGEIGFGVATCPSNLLPSGWRGLDGHDNIMSPNYGNYVDANGSILVYIPKHYYMWSGNNCYISNNKLPGYVLDRSFVNAGAEINGVFIYKYGGGNINGIFASKQLVDPLSTGATHNPLSGLNGTPVNNYGGIYAAVKTAGNDYYTTSIFNYSMLARIAFAHGKAATSIVACAFSDVAPFMPKGNNNNALKDVNDTSVIFTPSGYSNCALTGSGAPFAKTTHNGQDCGVADLNGNMYEIASGFIRTDTDGFLVLKESVDIRTIANDSATGGAYDPTLYDVVDISDVIGTIAGWTYLGNGVNTVFAMSTDRTTAAYKRTAIGIPTVVGVSAAGTTEFGNDGLYKALANEMACIVGGHWSNIATAGVFHAYLSFSRTNSYAHTGGRASYLV